MPLSITIKELHATTGVHVRRAGKGKTPILITDRGQPVAVLTSPAHMRPSRRVRTILPEFAALMAQTPVKDVAEDLDFVRGER
jgi:prevent-host-death family protein